MSLDPHGQTNQPLPEPNDLPAVHGLLIDDIKARDAFGQRKYGQPLRPLNGRNSMRDAYEEVLDLAVYMRQLIFEDGLNQSNAAMVAVHRDEVARMCATSAALERKACIELLRNFIEREVLPDSPPQRALMAAIKIIEERGSSETA